MQFQTRFLSLILLAVFFFWTPTVSADTVAELIEAAQSSDTAKRQSAETKLRTLLKTNFAVPDAQLDRAVEKLTAQLIAYDKWRVSSTAEYAGYTENIRRDSGRTRPLEYYVERYAGLRDAQIAGFLSREFRKSPKEMDAAELGAQKAFIKLMLPQYTALGPNGYACVDFDRRFSSEPLFRVDATGPGGPQHLFHDEMKEMHRAALNARYSEEGPAEFEEVLKYVLREDRYGVLPQDNKEARMDALADILTKASANLGNQFKLEEYLERSQGKTFYYGPDKKRVTFEIDKYDLAGRMIQRMEANQLGTAAKAEVSRQLLDFLGVYRQGGGRDFVAALIDWDATYRSNSPALNDQNALASAKRTKVISMLAEQVKKDTELHKAPLSRWSPGYTIGSATEWLDNHQKALLQNPRRLSEIHCGQTMAELNRVGLHGLTLSTSR